MTGFVVDCSVFLAWCLADEENPDANAAMHRLTDEGAVVPQIWWYELRNALLMNERRGRITAQQVADTLSDSTKLGIAVDADHDESAITAGWRTSCRASTAWKHATSSTRTDTVTWNWSGTRR